MASCSSRTLHLGPSLALHSNTNLASRKLEPLILAGSGDSRRELAQRHTRKPLQAWLWSSGIFSSHCFAMVSKCTVLSTTCLDFACFDVWSGRGDHHISLFLRRIACHSRHSQETPTGSALLHSSHPFGWTKTKTLWRSLHSGSSLGSIGWQKQRKVDIPAVSPGKVWQHRDTSETPPTPGRVQWGWGGGGMLTFTNTCKSRMAQAVGFADVVDTMFDTLVQRPTITILWMLPSLQTQLPLSKLHRRWRKILAQLRTGWVHDVSVHGREEFRK